MSQGLVAQDALLKWVNKFPIGFEVNSLDDLEDGLALAKVMGDIDPNYPAVDSSTADLKDVVRFLFKYIRAKCDDLVLLLDTPGLKSFLKSGKGDVAELVSTFLMAAALGPARERYLKDIPLKFDSDTQLGLQTVIQKKLQKIQEQKDVIESSSHAPATAELEFEERYGSLVQSKQVLETENAVLKKKIDVLENDLDRMQLNHDKLQDDCIAAQAQLDQIANKGDTASMIEALRRDVQDREDLIASQEAALEANRVAKEITQAEILSYKAGANELITVKDELRSIERENVKLVKTNADLEKKANMAEHFRKKLESVRDYEGECGELTRINDDLQKDLVDLGRYKHQHAEQAKRIADFQRVLTQNESEIYELTIQKTNFSTENMHLQNQIIGLEHNIAQLEESRNSFGDSPSSPKSQHHGNLADEMADNQKEATDSMVIAALRAELSILKKNSFATQDNGTLRNELDDAQRSLGILATKHNVAFEKLAIAEHQVRAILDKATGEGLVSGLNEALLIGELNLLTPEYYRTEAFQRLLKAHEAATNDLLAMTKRATEADAELEQTKRDLLELRTDCMLRPEPQFWVMGTDFHTVSAIEQEDRDALEQLKNTQETIAFSLQNELKDLQNRYKNLDLDYQQQKTQLIEVLVAKNELQEKKVLGAQDDAMLRQQKEDNRILEELNQKNKEVSDKKEKGLRMFRHAVFSSPASKLRNKFATWSLHHSPKRSLRELQSQILVQKNIFPPDTNVVEYLTKVDAAEQDETNELAAEIAIFTPVPKPVVDLSSLPKPPRQAHLQELSSRSMRKAF